MKVLCFMAILVAWAASYGMGVATASTHDSFIKAMEAAFGVAPGVKKPLMQCQCSVEYLGTRPQGGGVYAVLIKKLD